MESLVTIGTPHRGSPVANAIADQLSKNVGALHELTTAFVEHFDDTTPNVKGGVRYINVAGDASRGGHELFLFQLAAIIGKFGKGEINDGVVSETSALRKGDEHLPNWPVDHAGEVGWSFATPLPIEIEVPGFAPPPHFARYDEILKRL